MKFARFFLLIGWLVVLASPARSWQIALESTKANLMMGWGAVEITPRLGTSMAGYYGRRAAEGTHDPLWSKGIVFQESDRVAAIVVVDLIATSGWMIEESRRLIQERLQIPPEAVMISATHSHTGPVLSNGSNRYEIFGGEDPLNKAYMAQLPERICESVALAKKNLREVQLRGAVGEERKLAFNRRFFLRDGSVGWNPGKLNPKIVREAGPTDDSLPLVGVFSLKEEPLAVLANYSIHLDTVGGTEWSADVPYTIEQSMKQVFGKEVFLQYGTGCCGDVNHIDVRTKMPQKGHGEAARIGLRLAASILRTWPDMPTISAGPLRFQRKRVQLECDPIRPERVDWAKQIMEQVREGKTPAPKFMEMVEAFKVLDIHDRDGKPWETEVQVIAVGDSVAWVALPGEVFVQLGLAIKDGSPYPITMVNELANGSLGYIPTRQAFAQGNYEVVSSRVAPGSGERLVEAALELLRNAQ